MTPKQRRMQVERAVDRFEYATIDFYLSGGGDPEEMEAKLKRYHKSRANLLKVILGDRKLPMRALVDEVFGGVGA